MQSTRSGNDFEAGAQVEMVGIAQNDLRAHLVQFARVESLDAGLRADGHKHRRLDDAARGGQSAEARFGVRVGFKEFKHRAEDKSKPVRLKMNFSASAAGKTA
jgi:hypothetical protein